jgi:poly(3-hydroxybutyrate) depolymerase
VNGTKHFANLHIPDNFDPAKPRPLIISSHGRFNSTDVGQFTVGLGMPAIEANAWEYQALFDSLGRVSELEDGPLILYVNRRKQLTCWDDQCSAEDLQKYPRQPSTRGYATWCDTESCCCINDAPGWARGDYTVGPDKHEVDRTEAYLDLLLAANLYDPKRVYFTGFSTGGQEAHVHACLLSHRIAAFAPVAGWMGSTQPGPYFDLRRVNLTQPDKGIVVMPFDDCKPTRPVPIHHFHGDLDLTIGLRGVMTGTGPESTSYPANGGTWSDPGYGSLPAGRHVIGRLNTTAEIMEWWRRKNGCDEDFQVVDVGDSGVAVTRACATDPRKAVGLMVFKGEGHTWPGNGADIAQLQLSRKGRTTNYTTNTTAVVWDWLKRFNLPGPEEEVNGGHLFLGVSFSFFGNLGIAASMCVQKRAHNMIVDDGDKIKFYQSPMWWFGMIMNIIGEVGNLLAYGFAPASVVAPVGAVGVVGNCIFAWYFLKEHLGVRDFIGTGVVMIGVILVVVGAPETSHHSSMDAWEFYYFVAKPVRPPPPARMRA